MLQFNLKRQIKKLSNRTNYFTVLSEALTNSIQANAEKIDVTIEIEKDLTSGIEESGDDLGELIKSISIKDFGDGFTKENLKSFCVYGSEHKAELGCKGIGRVTYLKVFSEVHI